MQVPCTGLDQLWRAYEVFEQQGSSRALSRRVLEQQRPRYQAARTALGPRTRLVEALNPAALALTPGTIPPAVLWVVCLQQGHSSIVQVITDTL